MYWSKEFFHQVGKKNDYRNNPHLSIEVLGGPLSWSGHFGHDTAYLLLKEFKHRTVPPRTQTPYRPTKNSNTVPSQQIFKHCTTVPLLAWPLIISCKLFLPRSPTRISLVIRRMRRDVGKHSFENRNIRSWTKHLQAYWRLSTVNCTLLPPGVNCQLHTTATGCQLSTAHYCHRVSTHLQWVSK